MKVELDSKEELYFSWWLEELVENNFVEQFTKASSYTLFKGITNTYFKKLVTKSKVVEETLLQNHVYTPDFEIHWTDNAKDLFFSLQGEKIIAPFIANVNIFRKAESIVECKPSYDFKNMTRLSVINIKWMADKYGIIVNKIQVEKLFKNTFTPKRYLLTDKGNQNRIINKWSPITLNEYITKTKNGLQII